MRYLFVVAENAFTVTVNENLAAWRFLKGRFEPFAAEGAAEPVLEVEVKPGRGLMATGERIYDPEPGDVGIITGAVSRMADGSHVLEFQHVDEKKTRLWMTMSPEFNRAEIVMTEVDGNDPYFLTHALMLAFMMATCSNGTLLMHASSVVYDGKAYLFQGKSGTGKSTHARLWTRNIAGAELLNDDNPLIRFGADGRAMAYGSPWSGKTHCYRNVSAPVGGFVRIVRGLENELVRLSALRGYASLTSSMFYLPFLNEALREKRHKTIERLAGSVACYEMHCRPDADAALKCREGVCG